MFRLKHTGEDVVAAVRETGQKLLLAVGVAIGIALAALVMGVMALVPAA